MSLRNIFSYAKNSVLDFDVFCSRSVLVLNLKNFLCSCSVLVREQEQVREHVLEQLACSFIPDPKRKPLLIFKLNIGSVLFSRYKYYGSENLLNWGV